jgi:hypothetical protein
MHVGYVGLLKAINNFDPALGFSLAKYARPCVTREIKKHFGIEAGRRMSGAALAVRRNDEVPVVCRAGRPDDPAGWQRPGGVDRCPALRKRPPAGVSGAVTFSCGPGLWSVSFDAIRRHVPPGPAAARATVLKADSSSAQ